MERRLTEKRRIERRMAERRAIQGKINSTGVCAARDALT
jgi:hypothetical protein